MKISFLITYYNQQNYVNDSLRSVSKLKIPCEYEVLIGDDGSEDRTLEQIEKWKVFFQNHLQVYKMPREFGKRYDPVIRASNLRKYLLKQSTGDFFCILDGDDYYCDCDFVTDALQIYKDHPDVSVVMFNYQKVYPERIETARPIQVEGFVENQEYIRNYYKHAGGCVLKRFSTDSFNIPIERALYYDDTDIPIYNLRFGKLWNINRVVYSYRQHNDSIWNAMNRAQQGILNVVGADNEVFLAPQFKYDIFFRFRQDIFYSYFRREYQEDIVGKEFVDKYRSLCVDKKGYISRILLDYKNATEVEKKEIYELISYLKSEDENLYKKVKDNCISEGGGDK